MSDPAITRAELRAELEALEGRIVGRVLQALEGRGTVGRAKKPEPPVPTVTTATASKARRELVRLGLISERR